MRRALAALALAALAACGGGATAGTVEGLITEVSQESVTVQADDGGTETFVNGDESVPVSHLEEHRDRKLPVRIAWQTRDGLRVATAIADA